MSYPTINGRIIIVPELSSTFRVESIPLPEEFRQVASRGRSSTKMSDEGDGGIDDVLELLCQKIFSVAPTNILTFSRWRDITETVDEALRKPSYLDDIQKRSKFKADERPAMENWLKQNRFKLATLAQQFGTVESFVNGFLLNGVLAPLPGLGHADAFDLQKFTDSPRILEAIYWQFRDEGLTELDLLRWHEVSQILTGATFPSAKLVDEELDSYQLPMAASPTLKPISLKEFKKLCYGAAALSIGGSGLSALAGAQQGNPHVLACVLLGAVEALVFVSVAEVAEYIENHLKGRAAAKARPKRKARSSTAKRAA